MTNPLQTLSIGGEAYFAYASVAFADVYLAVDINRSAAWSAKTTDEKATLLVAATNALDAMVSFTGEATDNTQATSWPRSGVTLANGYPVADNEIPLVISRVTCILAGTAATTPSALETMTTANNKRRVKSGTAEVEFFRPEDGVPMSDPRAFRMLQSAGLVSGSALVSAKTGPVASGTDVTYTDRFGGYT